MNLTPEIIEAFITGLIIGLGMVAYRVYQHQTQNSADDNESHQGHSSGNGFRVAMEGVKEAHAVSVELLHDQIDHMQEHVVKLEQENTVKDGIIDRLQELLLAQGIVTNEHGYVIGYRIKEAPES